MKRIALVSMVALACSTAHVARHTVATAPYDPQRRDEVWSRALGEFQSRGLLVTVSDHEGGVLASQQQPASVACDGGLCDATVAQQLTLTAGGLATLRTNREIAATRVAPAFEAQYQQETNGLLTAIAGAPATTFLPPAPPQAVPAPGAKKPRPSATCETYQDCPTGSLCVDGVCRP